MLAPYQKANWKQKAPFRNRQAPSAKGDILRVFERYTGGRPKKVGSVWMGHCFLHEEKTPSLALYGQDRGWYCYGCGKFGDSIDIVQYFEKCGYKEALNILRHI